MKKSEVEARLKSGEKLGDLFDLRPGQECEIFKADQFVRGEEVIYIPDIELNEIPFDRPVEDAGELEEVLSCCYTGMDFLSECLGNEELAERLFWYCDWQHPSSAYPEVCDDD